MEPTGSGGFEELCPCPFEGYGGPGFLGPGSDGKNGHLAWFEDDRNPRWTSGKVEVPMVRKLILTADDFGSSLAVNEAIEEAHLNGVLNTASLMVGARAAGDAVDRARRLPSLRVGMHLVLVDGTPISPPHTIPSLVNSRVEFSSHLLRAGIDFYLRAGVRQQLEREIRAQFQAFHDTGLVLDHVNCHKHMHLHPTIGRLLLKVGREYGLKAVRYPYEPVLPSWRASRAEGPRPKVVILALPIALACYPKKTTPSGAGAL